MPVFLNHFQSFILTRAKLMLTFFENGLELWPETVFEMGELKILVSFIVARARNSDGFFFIDDTSFGISWKGVPSFLDAIKHKRSIPFILSRSWDILFISQIGFIAIAKRSWPIGKRIDFVVVKAFFTSGIKEKLRRLMSPLEAFSFIERIQLFGQGFVELRHLQVEMNMKTSIN